MGGGGIAGKYRSSVIQDGGTVTDYNYLKARIQHAKDNDYFNNIVWWGSPAFGVKQSANLTSKLYDVIDVENNSLVSTVGSEQPEFISSAQNARAALRSDGIDDSLYTTHLNSILAAGREYVMLFIFKPITHNASSLRTYFQNKQEGVYDNCLRQSSASLNYDLVANRNSATNSNVSVKRLTGVANNSFSILAVNFRAKGTWTLNDQIGNYFNTLLSNTNGLRGLSLFGNYDSNLTNFQNSKTNFDFYELMIIDKGTIGYTLLTDIKKQANDYYNGYTNFDFETTGRLLDGVSNLEGVFSLYNRVTGYVGNCIRLRRDSDDTEQDFGFTSDFIDLAAIATFKGAANLYVRTWYDQSAVNNFNQTTNALQPQFFSTGGGDDNLQPYIKFIAASNTKMDKTSTLTSADLFKTYLVAKKTTAAATIWTTGTTTNYFNFGLPAGNLYAINKRVGGANYYKRSTNNWSANGENGLMAVICVGNLANTPSRNDLQINLQTYEDTTSDSGQFTDAGSNLMSIGRGNGGTSYDGDMYELIIVRNITHNQSTIENNLVRIYQKLP